MLLQLRPSVPARSNVRATTATRPVVAVVVAVARVLFKVCFGAADGAAQSYGLTELEEKSFARDNYVA